MIEIERKFLVTSNAFKEESIKRIRIIQGFLNTDKDRTVRVRLKGEKGFLTVKGKSTNNGLSRFEWEKKIPKTDAEALLKLCEKGIIDKVRYEIKVGNHIFEVDEFLGDNEGLTIAEVELNSENEPFEKPDWLARGLSTNVEQQQLLIDDISEIISQRTLEQWMTIFEPLNTCIEPVLTVSQAANSTLMADRKMIVDVEIAEGETVQQIAPAIKFIEQAQTMFVTEPNEKNTYNLMSSLGYNDEEINQLFKSNAVK